MEGWQVIFVTMYGAFLGWIALSHIQQGKKIVSTQSMMTGLSASIDRLTIAVNELDNKLDLFLKSEIDTLKEIARSVSNGKP